MLAEGRLIDLTRPLGPETVLWPGSEPFEACVEAAHEQDGLYFRRLTLGEHDGTHLDAPIHFAPGGRAADQLPLASLVLPAVRLDARALVAGDPAYTLTAAELAALEREQARVRPGTAVLVCTGWDEHVADARGYAGDRGAPPAFPGLAPDAAELIVARGAVGIGIDTLGIDPGHATGMPAHRITQPAGLWHLEGLVRLDRVPAKGAWLVAGVIPVVAGSGAPARAFAILPPA